ncbi:LIM and calponin homology domains-containing protein 1 isoform X15 [Amblyraja radiata]|uniref:LIM and calponin homology domains-containing protein 1 isoform X15 n=1 Tax=Amblyraja radiata TaxID=386614 RepID=UPI001402E24A|nr:LIM and calponin homology domains-containing protein 1 isoform X15 [Amblyraja radiata]
MASPNVRDGEWGETPHQDSGSGPGPAFIEAQHWIEQVTGRGFGDKDFRTGLENGILLCELLNAIKPGAVKKINRLPTPIAGLDNITLFLRACEELGLKGSQLFDPGDLQDMTNRASVKVPECSRKMKNVLITIYWLGKAANSCTSYSGPTLNLKEFEGLLAQIQKEMEDTESPKRSVRDSGYIDSWDSERSDSLSPPRHARDDSFDSLESFGSRSQQTPSPDVIFRGSSDGRGSDSESDVASKIPDVKRDDMSARRSSYNDPKSSLPFNQYLPNKHNHTAYMPAPLRKKRAERGENYRKSWSNATSPVGAERPFSHSHPEPIQEEHSEESSQGEDFADPSSTFPNTQEINDSKPTVKSNLVAAEDVGGLKNPLEVHLVEDPGHKASKECTRREGKEEDEIKKLKRIQKAGITVLPAAERYRSCEPEETFLSDTCTAEYFPRIPSPVLVAHTVTINKNAQDSSEGSEDDEEGIPDVEKDDMMSRRIRDTAKQSSASFNKFLPVPSSQQDQELSGINKEAEREPKKRRKSEDESQRTYSPTAALSDDTGSVSMNDMRTEDDGPTQPHSKARHEELHKVHSRLREDQDKWQDDLARWKSRRRSASQDLIKRKEERDIVEKIMSGERSLSERRKSIKTYKEIVEEKESREKELQEAYKKARTPEEAEEILKKYSQRFMISEAFLENLEMPKFLERSQSVDSDSSCSPTREPNSLKYLRQQSLPIQKYTATVEAVIIPSSQPQANFTAMVTSPTKTVASKAVPMLTPKPYSQPKDSQTVLKSFKKNGKVRINGETSPTFTRVEENESTSPGLSPLLTRSQMFEGVARVDSPLQLQEDNSNRVSRLEQLASSAINNPQTENTDKEEQAEMTIVITTTQQANTKDDSELKSFCNEQKEESVINADDPQRDLDISIVHIALSDNAELDIRDAVESKIMTSAEACLLPKSEASNNSPQEQFKQEGLKSTTHQQDKTGDVLDSDQVISELKEEVTENSRYDDAINQQDSPSGSGMICCSAGSEQADEAVVGFADSATEPANFASVPVTVRNSWRRSEFFSLPAEVDSSENINIPVASLNLPKHFDRWYWDPEEERKRQERWQKEQERLLQEKYRKEHEKLRQEWEKAQKEVEEEERRYHEEERKIIEETVTPLTPRSVPVQLPSEWLSISKAEEVRNSESTELTHGESKQTELQKQTMVEIDSCQKGDEGGLLVQETQSQKDTKQRSTQTQAEALRSNDENGSEENQEVAERNSLEKWHWQDTKQLESETLKLNLQSAPHFSQRDEETDSERQIQARSQTLITDHHQVSAQAADSPVFPDRYQNAQEPPLFLDVHRNQLSNVPDEQKTGSLDRSWAHQSNMMDRKKWSGSHENLQSSQSLLQPPSSPTPLQSPGRSVSGKKLCSTCGLPLGKGAAMIIETLSLYFHIQCFTCGICRGQLGDATTGTDVRIRNGLLNCNDCYIRSRTAGQPTTL